MKQFAPKTSSLFLFASILLLIVCGVSRAADTTAAGAAHPPPLSATVDASAPEPVEELSCEEHTTYLVSIINALNLNNARLTAKIAALEAPQKERAALDAGRAIQSLTAQYLASHEMPPGCALRIDGTFVCPTETVAAVGEQPRE